MCTSSGYDYLLMTREKYEGIWNLNLYLKVEQKASVKHGGLSQKQQKTASIEKNKWSWNQEFTISFPDVPN